MSETVRREVGTEGSPDQCIIGRTTATERVPNTVDQFAFWIGQDVIINPFDFVTVEHLEGTQTIGMIQEMEAITDAQSHLSGFVSSEFGNVNIEPNTPRIGTTIAKAAVMANTGIPVGGRSNVEINMPVENDRPVRFATAEEVRLALGVGEMRLPIPAGIIEMSNGTCVPITFNADYLIGPEAAHINVSGISGLATKTSYMMFVIQALYQRIGSQNLAIILFNVKGDDLLHIHEGPESGYLTDRDMTLYRGLGVEPVPFQNVDYFLPRGPDDRPNSYHEPEGARIYAYSLEDVRDRLDLLFSEIEDPHFTIDSITSFIRESAWPLSLSTQRGGTTTVRCWRDLANPQIMFPRDVVTHLPSLGRFRRHLRRFRNSNLLVEARGQNQVYLGDFIRSIARGQIVVIDIARITSTEEQAFVIGDVMRSVDDIYAEIGIERPRLVILVDELNRYAPNVRDISAVGLQIIEIARTGRSRGTVLFGAQQFKSAVHLQVNENCSTHVIGRTGSSELSNRPYRFLDDDTKLHVTRLSHGELIVSHPTFRRPVKIVFPRPAYKRIERGVGRSGQSSGGEHQPRFYGTR